MGETVNVIANARVSTDKQSINGHSLENQKTLADNYAEKNNWLIVKRWSGAHLSKAGKNTKRTDVNEMIAYCKKHKNIRYAVFDEPTRVMRSVDEAGWFITELKRCGTQLVFSSRPEYLDADDGGKLRMLLEFYQGEVENSARSSNVKSGMRGRVVAGYFPHQPKAGYKQSLTPGLHEVDSERFDLLRTAFRSIAKGTKTPKQALTAMNQAGYRTPSGRMLDATHFKIMLEDPYYYGAIKVKNVPLSSGLHKPLISELEFKKIQLRIADTKPRLYVKHYNPNYPLAKVASCGECITIRKITGSTSTNKQKRRYERYICRKCRKTFAKSLVHDSYIELLKRVYVRPELAEKFMNAVVRVYRRNNEMHLLQLQNYDREIAKFDELMSQVTMSFATATNETMKQSLEQQLERLEKQKLDLVDKRLAIANIDANIDKFARFVADFMSSLPENWFKLTPEMRETCQKLIFPGELLIHADGKVSTTKLSSIYRLLTMKKGTGMPSISYMVSLRGPSAKHFWDSLERLGDQLEEVGVGDEEDKNV